MKNIILGLLLLLSLYVAQSFLWGLFLYSVCKIADVPYVGHTSYLGFTVIAGLFVAFKATSSINAFRKIQDDDAEARVHIFISLITPIACIVAFIVLYNLVRYFL